MNRFIGIAMLLYGPINPTGVIPIYVSLVGKVEPAKAGAQNHPECISGGGRLVSRCIARLKATSF